LTWGATCVAEAAEDSEEGGLSISGTGDTQIVI
jgi:hypothetical protein